MKIDRLPTRALYAARAALVASSVVITAPLAATENIAAETAADADATTIVVTAARQKQTLNQESTASRLGLSLREIPASVEVIDGDLIRLRGDRSIVDAVTRGGGITSVATPGNGLTGLAARGFSGQGSVMQLLDGTRLFVGAGTLTFPFDPWTVDRIEVLRGPASVMYGEGAIGGAINVVTKRPGGDRLRYDGELAIGSFETACIGVGVGGPLGGGVSFRIDGSHQRSDGWLDLNDNSSSYALSAALRWDASDRLSISLSHDHGTNRPFPYFGMPLIDGRPDSRLRRVNYNVTDYEMRFIDDWTRLAIDWRHSDAVQLRSTGWRLHSNRNWRNAERFVVQPGAQSVQRSSFIAISHDQEQFGNRTDLSVDKPVFGLENRLLVGFEVNDISFRHTNNAPFAGSDQVGLLAFDPGRFLFASPFGPGFATDTRQFAIFSEDRLKLATNLSVVGGLRHDDYGVSRRDFRNPALGFDTDLAATTWRLGLVWDVTSAVTLYGQYGTGTDPLGALITTPFAQRDFGLTTGRQVEAGIKANFDEGRLELTAALFDITKDRLLSPDPANPQLVQQIGRRSARGAEAAINWQPVKALAIEANGTILEARFDDFIEIVGGQPVSRVGNTPPQVPRVTANLWVRWEVVDRLLLQGGVRHVGARWVDNANRIELPAYTVVDVGVRYAVTPNISVDARISNLFDAFYAVTSYGVNQWIVGEPQRLDVRLSLAY
jgi:iron complex outermembrane receptor protein